MRPITSVILAHLAASPLFACANEPSSPTPTSPATTTPASETATPVATASATPQLDAKCMAEGDCGAGMKCVLPFDGAHVIKGQPGRCRPANEPQMGGRALFVEGVARVSSRAAHREWHRDDASTLGDAESLAPWRQRLERAAFEEHASIAAFARTICQLLALGAPAWLVEKTQRALADEIAHATRTFEWVERLGGGALGPGPLPEAVAPLSSDVADFACDVFRGGCVGETLAAHEAAENADLAPLAALRVYHTQIAADEARHAALAFETAAWLRARFPAASLALDEEIAKLTEHERTFVEPLFDAAEIFNAGKSSKTRDF